MSDPINAHIEIRQTCAPTTTQRDAIHAAVQTLISQQPFVCDSLLPKHTYPPHVSRIAITGVRDALLHQNVDTLDFRVPFWRITATLHLYRHATTPSVPQPLSSFAIVTRVPAETLESTWDTLCFPPALPHRLLQFLLTASRLRRCGVDSAIVASNRYVVPHHRASPPRVTPP